jgi:hypothetical protein
MEVGLVKYHLHMFRVAIFKLPLEIAASVLVLTQSVKFTAVVLKRHIAKARELRSVCFSTATRI